MSPDQAAVRCARRRHGLITAAQAAAVGLTRAQVHCRLQSGRWVRRGRGVYQIAGYPESLAQAALAACLAGGDDVVAAGRTAAALWRLEGIAPGRGVEIAAPRHIRMAGVRARRTGHLPAADRATVQGVPVTSAARTLADLAPDLSAAALDTALDDAQRRNILRIERLARCVERLEARRRPLGALGALLRARLEAPDVGESPLETRALRALRRAGLPCPEPQYTVKIGGQRYDVDLAYPAQRIAIEVDGWAFHGQRGVFDADRRRGNRLVASDWRLLRFTSRMSDAELVQSVRHLLAHPANAPAPA